MLVVHLLLAQLSAPDQDEQSRLESETVDKVPKRGRAQILHELALALNRELKVDGKVEEVPEETHAEGYGRNTLRQCMILSHLLYDSQHREKRQYNDHGCHETVIGDPGQIGLHISLFEYQCHLARE